MPQSMLALLAMMLATRLMFGHQNLAIQAQQSMMRNELTMVAEGVLLERMSEISRAGFGALGSQAPFVERTVESDLAGEGLVFEIEFVARPVRNVGGAWLPDTDGSFDFQEVTLYVKGPVGAGGGTVALPEGPEGTRTRGAIHIKRVLSRLGQL